jgi:hypothetical protein
VHIRALPGPFHLLERHWFDIHAELARLAQIPHLISALGDGFRRNAAADAAATSRAWASSASVVAQAMVTMGEIQYILVTASRHTSDSQVGLAFLCRSCCAYCRMRPIAPQLVRPIAHQPTSRWRNPTSPAAVSTAATAVSPIREALVTWMAQCTWANGEMLKSGWLSC